MTDATEHNLRIGDRVIRRVPSAHKNGERIGDIIGITGGDMSVPRNAELPLVYIGWDDDTRTWQSPLELRLVAER